jgi:hypothetical protein
MLPGVVGGDKVGWREEKGAYEFCRMKELLRRAGLSHANGRSAFARIFTRFHARYWRARGPEGEGRSVCSGVSQRKGRRDKKRFRREMQLKDCLASSGDD